MVSMRGTTGTGPCLSGHNTEADVGFAYSKRSRKTSDSILSPSAHLRSSHIPSTYFEARHRLELA